MALPSLTWLSGVGTAAARLITWLGSGMSLVTWVFDIGEKMLAGGLNFMIDRLSTLDTSLFSKAAFATVAGIGYANAVFPLAEFVNIWTAVFTGISVVLIIRWVKSFIPTMAN